jgi:glycogen debranching enzyme
MIENCYEQAKKVIRSCCTKNGLFASAGIDGYNAVWSRDSMISMIGASLVKDNLFKETFKQSIITLGNWQSESGQIPNAVDRFSKRPKHTDFASIDSTLWWIIGLKTYKKRYNDPSLEKKYKKQLEKAIFWLKCQDTGEKGMLTQLPTSDWQDAFPHKYGYTINTEALYCKVLTLVNNKKALTNLKYSTNKNKDTRLWNDTFYVPYRWKNHNKYKEIGSWFDSLGNLLAIIFSLADDDQANKILKYIEKNNIQKLFPMRSINPPIKKGDKDWQDYYNDCDARTPHHYLNGGIWPFIGSFYILALIKQKQFKKAELELNKLAESNLKGNFPEWIDPNTKENYGNLQAWDAGTYILAYESLKQKKVLL